MSTVILTLTYRDDPNSGKRMRAVQTGGLIPDGYYSNIEKLPNGQYGWSELRSRIGPNGRGFSMWGGGKIDFIMSGATAENLDGQILTMRRNFMRIYTLFRKYVKLFDQLGEWRPREGDGQ